MNLHRHNPLDVHDTDSVVIPSQLMPVRQLLLLVLTPETKRHVTEQGLQALQGPQTADKNNEGDVSKTVDYLALIIQKSLNQFKSILISS